MESIYCGWCGEDLDGNHGLCNPPMVEELEDEEPPPRSTPVR